MGYEFEDLSRLADDLRGLAFNLTPDEIQAADPQNWLEDLWDWSWELTETIRKFAQAPFALDAMNIVMFAIARLQGIRSPRAENDEEVTGGKIREFIRSELGSLRRECYADLEWMGARCQALAYLTIGEKQTIPAAVFADIAHMHPGQVSRLDPTELTYENAIRRRPKRGGARRRPTGEDPVDGWECTCGETYIGAKPKQCRRPSCRGAIKAAMVFPSRE